MEEAMRATAADAVSAAARDKARARIGDAMASPDPHSSVESFKSAQPERSAFLVAGNPRPVLQAAAEALARGEPAVLALVLEVDGSTYARVGTLALFAGEKQVGWLSGGCLEPELARRAAESAQSGRLGWIELDTRDDGALFSGAALGCRGRLRIALLPLQALPGAEACVSRWLEGGAPLTFALGSDGRIAFATHDATRDARLPCDAPGWANAARRWSLPLPRLPEVLLLGVGPETPLLVPLLRDLGWRVSAAEPRPRWQAACAAADTRIAGGDDAMQNALASTDAALVMHHDFERDLMTLQTLAQAHVPFVGLLGPPRRRDDLLKLLDSAARDALAPRLHAPVGLDLGGQGPEAIALSIAAQLQAWRATRVRETEDARAA
jgi:xanthine dehydrogenase accessory factor